MQPRVDVGAGVQHKFPEQVMSKTLIMCAAASTMEPEVKVQSTVLSRDKKCRVLAPCGCLMHTEPPSIRDGRRG